MQNYPFDKLRTGFTLIELMVVMAIIGILAATIWGSFIPSLIKGRDSRRKQDLQAISKAVEIYYNDFRSYPTDISNWGEPLTNPNDTSVIYMQKLPLDPIYPSYTYCYISDGTYYKLYAHLENNSDPQKLPAEVACPEGGGILYNYGISSLNTTP